MVRTRSRATSPDPQESRGDRQSVPIEQPPSVQHVQSMAATMAELTRQNQELVRELNIRRQRHDGNTGGQAQSQDRRNVEFESQSRGTTSRRVTHLEREMDQMRRTMDEMKESIKRTNPVKYLVHKTDSPFVASINAHLLPPKFKMPSLDSYDGTRDPLTTLPPSKLPCTFKGFRMK